MGYQYGWLVVGKSGDKFPSLSTERSGKYLHMLIPLDCKRK